MKSYVLTAALALTFAACGGDTSSTTQPSPTPTQPTPSAPSPTGERTEWRVTQSFGSVVGPDNCWVREQRDQWTGAVFSNLETFVTRSGGSITVESPWFQVNYAGTFNGADFSATGMKPLTGGGQPCRDGSFFEQLPGASNLTGHFSADDQQMTAAEVKLLSPHDR
jgi:hypothetical protein